MPIHAATQWKRVINTIFDMMDATTLAIRTLGYLNLRPRLRDTLAMMTSTPNSDCPTLWTAVNETTGTKLDDRAPGDLEATRPPRCPICGCRRMRRGQTQENIPIFLCNAYPTCNTVRRAPPLGEPTTSSYTSKCSHTDDAQKSVVTRYGNATGSYKKCTRCDTKWKFDVTTNRWEDFVPRGKTSRGARTSASSASSSSARSPESSAAEPAPRSPAPPRTDDPPPQRASYPRGQSSPLIPANAVHLPDQDEDEFQEMMVDDGILALEWQSPLG